MLEIVTKQDLKSILDRLDVLEKWKARSQCPACKGEGFIDNYHPHNGEDWRKCEDCNETGLNIKKEKND